MRKTYSLLSALVFLSIILAGCDSVKQDAINDAVAAKDPSKCKGLPEKADQEDCYAEVAQELHDPAMCAGSSNANECITQYAVRARSTTTCDAIKDVAAKYTCVARVTGDQTGRSIDTMIAEWRNKNVIESCKKDCIKTAYNTCIVPCEAKRTAGHQHCLETDPHDLGNCFYPYNVEADKCVEGCRWDQWDCEDRCKQTAEGS